MLTVSKILDYEAINYKNKSFEKSLRHIKEYDDLLTEIETKSKSLDDILTNIRGWISGTDNLLVYNTVHEDLVRYNESYVQHEYAHVGYFEYCNHMKDEIRKYLDVLNSRIINEIDPLVYKAANDLYEEIYFLLDDKYNEFDKHYIDDY